MKEEILQFAAKEDLRNLQKMTTYAAFINQLSQYLELTQEE